MITHYFDFVTSGHGVLPIGEPEGFDKASFVIKQDTDRLGRDISYAGGKSSFRIYHNSQNEYHFDKVLLNWNLYGINAVIKYKIQFDDEIFVIGELEMGETFKTDYVTYIDFNVIQEDFVALFKKRFDVPIDLFADEDVDGNSITRVGTKKMLLKAVPTPQRSEWDNKQETFSTVFVGYGQDVAYIAPFKNNSGLPYDIKVTNVPFQQYTELPSLFSEQQLRDVRDDITLIRAKTNLTNIKVKITGFTLQTATSGFYVRTRASLCYGTSQATGQFTLVDLFDTNNDVNIVNANYEVDIPSIPNTGFFWVQVTVFQPYSLPAATPVSTTSIYLKADNLSVEVISTAYNTVVDVVRLVDAMKQTALATSANTVSAPRWDVNGEFYNQFIFTTSLMRGLRDRPFNLSNKIIAEKYCPEVYADYEVQPDGIIFYGLYKDFYRNEEIAVFDQKQSEFGATTNPKYACNLLKYKYENSQAQKETEVNNTLDIVHADAEFLYPNRKAQNTKEVSIGVIRDPYLTNENRIKAYAVSNTAATQDDSKIFIVDAVVNQRTITITETTLLQHNVNRDGSLTLSNQGEISWELLGIEPGFIFTIFSGANAGAYIVRSVNGNSITLEPNGLNLVNYEELSTKYAYVLLNIDLVNRTDEGFTLIEGLNSKTGFGNLPYTVQRNIENYYNEFNATNCLYVPGQPITNRIYNYNKELGTVFGNGQYIKEGESFVPTGAILTPKLINSTIECSLKQWYGFLNGLSPKRGYVRLITPEGLPIKLYTTSGDWTAETSNQNDMRDYYGSAKMQFEEKYAPETLAIVGQTGDITINNEIKPSGATFHIDSIGKLSIFDSTGRLLHIPTLYTMVTVNGATPSSKQDLGEMMEQLTPEWDGI